MGMSTNELGMMKIEIDVNYPMNKFRGLSLPHQEGRDDRRVDFRLARDVSSANKVGIRGKATLLAGE